MASVRARSFLLALLHATENDTWVDASQGDSERRSESLEVEVQESPPPLEGTKGLPHFLRGGVAILALCLVMGGLWGAVEGLWLIAPTLIEAHRIEPATVGHWVVLELAIAVISAGLGASMALLAAAPILAWPRVRRRPFRDPGWALALALASAIPLWYVIIAMAIEWQFFGRVALSAYAPAVPVAAILAIAGAFAYRRAVKRASRPSLGILAALLVLLVALGALVLPYRVPDPPPVAAEDGGPLLRQPEARAPPAPVLFVGLDSGNWQTLRPLLERGALPVFSRLIDEGMKGEIEALWPPYWSAAAWAAILTGHPREETRVYGDLAIEAPGLPFFDAPLDGKAILDPFLLVEWTFLGARWIRAMPPPRAMLQRPPVWELLSDAGVKSAVVRFDFTFPAADGCEYTISNRAGRDSWDWARVEKWNGDGLASPAAIAKELLSPFGDHFPEDDALLARFLTGPPRKRSRHVAFELEMLRIALDIDRRTTEAALRILERSPDLGFLAVYLGGFDNVCHAFWPYRFPEAYEKKRPAPEDIAEFEGVIDRYLEFVDGCLARLISAYPTRPNVLIVSDHGHVAIEDHPLWLGWHGREGIFIGSGPAFPRRGDALHVSYYDIVPTLADALGLRASPGMHGSSLLARPPGASPEPPR